MPLAREQPETGARIWSPKLPRVSGPLQEGKEVDTFLEHLLRHFFGTLVETLFGTLVVHTFFVTLYRKENRFYHSSQNCQNWIVKLP